MASKDEKIEKNMTQKASCKNFKKPDEVRIFPKGRLELIQLEGSTIGRAIFEPGWRWEESVQPLAGTKSCLAPHLQFHVSGILHIVMDDGTEFDCYPGDVSLLPEGHDAWTVGDENVEVIDFYGMVDYSQERQARAEKSLSRLVMESPVPTIVQDGTSEDAPIKINHRFEEILGFSNELIPDLASLWRRITPDKNYREKMAALWNKRLEESTEGKVEPIELHVTSKDGSKRIFDVHLTKTDVQSIAVFVDLTEQYQLKDYLSYAALHDELTGLLNRRGYNQEVAQAWRLAQFAHTTLALFMIDIDYFKNYNDLYGHGTGDLCLKTVANALENELRRSGDTVARIGGEEFVVIMQNTSEQGSMQLAENMRKSIEDLDIVHANSHDNGKVTISIGLVTGYNHQDINTPEQLLEEADKQLYLAKRQGRNRTVAKSYL